MSRNAQFAKPGVALTAAVFYVLLSLSIKERHGYEILKYVEANSEGRVRLGPGTLYTTLKRMLEAGLISELIDRPEPENDDPRRRYYELSPRGRAELGGELSRMQHAIKLAGKRIRGST